MSGEVEFPSITRPTWFQREEGGDDPWAPHAPALLVAFDGGGHWDLCSTTGPSVRSAALATGLWTG